MTAAGSDHHVAVLLEDDVGAVVKVQHRDAIELRWGAAGLGDCLRVDEVHLRLEEVRVNLQSTWRLL